MVGVRPSASQIRSSPQPKRKSRKPPPTLAISLQETWRSYPTQLALIEVGLKISARHFIFKSGNGLGPDFHKSGPKPFPFETLSPKVTGRESPPYPSARLKACEEQNKANPKSHQKQRPPPFKPMRFMRRTHSNFLLVSPLNPTRNKSARLCRLSLIPPRLFCSRRHVARDPRAR